MLDKMQDNHTWIILTSSSLGTQSYPGSLLVFRTFGSCERNELVMRVMKKLNLPMLECLVAMGQPRLGSIYCPAFVDSIYEMRMAQHVPKACE